MISDITGIQFWTGESRPDFIPQITTMLHCMNTTSVNTRWSNLKSGTKYNCPHLHNFNCSFISFKILPSLRQARLGMGRNSDIGIVKGWGSNHCSAYSDAFYKQKRLYSDFKFMTIIRNCILHKFMYEKPIIMFTFFTDWGDWLFIIPDIPGYLPSRSYHNFRSWIISLDTLSTI